jgi:hypothetical protein
MLRQERHVASFAPRTIPLPTNRFDTEDSESTFPWAAE